ncbi:unnamed protein product [Allacma fusca]|uniref:Uncharacterized protein n=1 Tax=Allacma fusca TaxID=39272 RepID=A0A8J2PEF3_9HEXA|nr:unnamed protein product [Allacma fusca]
MFLKLNSGFLIRVLTSLSMCFRFWHTIWRTLRYNLWKDNINPPEVIPADNNDLLVLDHGEAIDGIEDEQWFDALDDGEIEEDEGFFEDF